MMKRKPVAIAKVAAKPELKAIRAALTHMVFSIAILILAILLVAQVFAKPAPQKGAGSDSKSVDQPVELGDVQWLRDLDTAVSTSKQQKKPIAILFQEVPG